MDLESPDWDRSPSLIEEVKADPYTTPMVKQEDIKLEDVKLEDVEPEDTASTALVLTTPPASTTAVLPPPPKTPPILPPPHRNRSTHTTTATQPQPRMTTHHAGSKPPPPRRPPPSTSSSTSSEDPVILTTNVPLLQKSRPGQPPHRLLPQLHPPTAPIVPPPSLVPSSSQQPMLTPTSYTPSGTGHRSQTALPRQILNHASSTFPITPSTTSIRSMHHPIQHSNLHHIVLIPHFRQPTLHIRTHPSHHALHHRQPSLLAPFRHRHNLHRKHFSHHFLPSQTSASPTSKHSTDCPQCSCSGRHEHDHAVSACSQ